MTDNNIWYALWTKPRKEQILYQQVLSRNIECFFPRIQVNPVNPRSAKIRPYFPGYIFVCVDNRKCGDSFFRWMPYSLGLVGCDGDPSPIPGNFISALKTRISEIKENGGILFDRLVPGAAVRIVDGPFQGHEAIFDARLDGKERVRILLQMINKRQVPIEMRLGQIAAMT